MINKNQARELAIKELANAYRRQPDLEIVIQDDKTIERNFGWVFFYTSKKFIETSDFRYMIIGNAPIIVDRDDGSLHKTGTAKPIEEYIVEFESARKIRKPNS